MANMRRAGQQLIGCQADEELACLVDTARGRKSRSFFLREALAEKLRAMGFSVSDDLVYPADPIRPILIAKQSGSNNSIKQSLSTSRSDAPSRSAAQDAKAGKKKKDKKK